MSAETWVAIGFLIFMGILVYVKVPNKIMEALDNRATKIRDELDEARKLREEAQTLLAELQRKRKEAEAEAAGIIETAKHEAEFLAREAEEKTADFIKRRTALAENKIAQAQAQAMAEVKSSAVTLAMKAAHQIVAEKATAADAAKKLFENSISDIKSKFN